MMLGKLPVLLIWIIVWQGPTVLAKQKKTLPARTRMPECNDCFRTHEVGLMVWCRFTDIESKENGERK